MNPESRLLVRIGLLSALILFLEMLLVRWLATELRVFAYLQNGVLVATFLGLGLGSRNSRTPARLLPAVVALLGVALVIRRSLELGHRGRCHARVGGFSGFGNLVRRARFDAQLHSHSASGVLAGRQLRTTGSTGLGLHSARPVAGLLDGRLPSTHRGLYGKYPGEPRRNHRVCCGDGGSDAAMALAGRWGRRARAMCSLRGGRQTAARPCGRRRIGPALAGLERWHAGDLVPLSEAHAGATRSRIARQGLR